MASEILSQRRYNLIYKRAMDYLNNRLGASASSISESYKNAFAAAYSM